MRAKVLKKVSESGIPDRDHILQFLPKKLVEISKSKNFEYGGKKLKTSYLIDLSHSLILKYYFKKENSFPLYSVILKEKYGQYYNYYMDYLIHIGVLILDKNYQKGRRSKVYSINKLVLTNEISRYKNSDKFILKKVKSKLEVNIKSKSPIPIEIRDKLVSDLYQFRIDYQKSYDFLESIDKDMDSLNKNLYCIESIKGGNLFHHFDKFGRFHTNFTILKSDIRKRYITIDSEETIEIDIKNSQPLFLSKLIKMVNTKWVNEEELDLFSNLVQDGQFYDFLVRNASLEDKEESKKLVYKVFFGQNRKGSKSDEKFKSIFPTIHNFIKLYKKENSDYRSLSHHLQKMESDLIFSKVIRRVMNINPDIKLLTIHDSIIVSKKYYEIVNRVFLDEISKI